MPTVRVGSVLVAGREPGTALLPENIEALLVCTLYVSQLSFWNCGRVWPCLVFLVPLDPKLRINF